MVPTIDGYFLVTTPQWYNLSLTCLLYCVYIALLTLQQPAPGAARTAKTSAIAQRCCSGLECPRGLRAEVAAALWVLLGFPPGHATGSIMSGISKATLPAM
jgi:hypothetical protein